MTRRFAIEIFAIGGWRTMRRGDAKGIAFPKPQIAEFGLTDASSAFENGIENRLQFAGL